MPLSGRAELGTLWRRGDLDAGYCHRGGTLRGALHTQQVSGAEIVCVT